MRRFLNEKYKVELDFVDLTKLENVEKAIKKNTKLIWIESPTNPTLKICDIEEICKIAKKNNILSLVDNTFSSPYISSPMLLGADIVLQSCTKYIGMISVLKIRRTLRRGYGGPHNKR